VPHHIAIRAIAVAVLLGGCGRGDRSSTELQFQLLPFSAAAAQAGFESKLGELTVQLFEPDNAQSPKAWEGPLKLVHAKVGSACTADVSLVTKVFGASGAGYLVVVSSSGSKQFIHYVDSKSCAPAWPALELYTEGIEISGDRMTVQPGCECPGDAAPCECSAARILKLTSNAAPAELAEESRALTQKILGVAFTGHAKVKDPKTSRAVLIKK
jgi:hypothetical protein